MKLITLITLHFLTLASLAQSTIPLMVGTNGNVLAPINFWATAPVLNASGGRATNATFFTPLPTTNYDTSTLLLTNCANPAALGTYSNMSGHAYEYVLGNSEAGANCWTALEGNFVRLYNWQSQTPVAQCTVGSFPVGLGGGYHALNVSTNSTAITALGDVIARDFKGRFAISVTGQVATIAPGSVAFVDGTACNVTGGTIKLAPSATNYLFLDLQDFSFHAFPRSIHSGGIYLGTVVTGTNNTAIVSQPNAFWPPANPIESFKRKLWSGRTNLYCVIAGDSLSADWSDRLAWAKAIFNPPATNLSFALPAYTNLTCDNLALGGSSSIWSWAMLCSSSVYGVQGASFIPDSVTYVNRDVGANLATPIQTGIESPILSKTPDLLIVGFGANRDDTYDALALETIVREYTARGCAVVIVTENKGGSAIPLAETPALLQAIATRYGAAIADTYSYVWEKNIPQGTNTYSDLIHQNQEGQYCWARAIRSVLNDYAQPDGAKNIGLVPRLTLNPTNGFQTNAPNWVHVQPAKWRSTGTATDANGSSISIASRICGLSQSQAVQAIAPAAQVYFSFPLATAIYVVTEAQAGTNMVVDVYRDTTHIFKTITITGNANGIQITKVFSDSEIRSLNTWSWIPCNPPEYRPTGFGLAANSGTLYLSAVLYLGPKITSINPASVQLAGTGWSTEPWRYNSTDYPQQPIWLNDTLNGTLTVGFRGNGIIIPAMNGSSAGKISAWVDGEQLLNAKDQYLAGTSGEIRYYNLFPRNSTGSTPLWANYGDHTLRLSWPGVNVSATASVAANRLVGILQSLAAVDTR